MCDVCCVMCVLCACSPGEGDERGEGLVCSGNAWSVDVSQRMPDPT